MKNENDQLGNISISYHAIATIAYQAALQSYGVVGLADANFARGFSRLLSKEPASGVMVRYDGDVINVDMYVIIEYGTRISSVANSVANNVRFSIEKMTGINVNEVNIHVRGLRVSDMD